MQICPKFFQLSGWIVGEIRNIIWAGYNWEFGERHTPGREKNFLEIYQNWSIKIT